MDPSIHITESPVIQCVCISLFHW